MKDGDKILELISNVDSKLIHILYEMFRNTEESPREKLEK